MLEFLNEILSACQGSNPSISDGMTGCFGQRGQHNMMPLYLEKEGVASHHHDKEEKG